MRALKNCHLSSNLRPPFDPRRHCPCLAPGGPEGGPSGRSAPGGDSREFETWPLAEWRCKVVDFGNACWTYKQFTDDIQTRQYR